MQFSLKNLTKKQLLIGVSLVVAIVFLLVFGGIFSTSRYEVLYQVSTSNEMPLIVQFLNKTGEDYEVQDKKILVKPENLRRLRMSLAAENVISNNSIIGYEIFNKPDMLGSSSFTQNINLVRSLEGELARTIMSFNNIQIARVHLVIPKKELFSGMQGKPSASVMLKLLNNHDLSGKQVSAIANLVASAVPNLDHNSVTIVSSDGKPYKINRNEEEESPSYFQEYKLEVEKHLKKSVESLIENVVGFGKVKAEVTVDIDFDKLIIDSEKYNPDEQVVRSAQTVQDTAGESDNSANVSVSNNVGTDGSTEGGGKSSNSQHSEETKNYEISKETRRYIKEIGTIKKLSMAVIVDGSYTKDSKSEKLIYSPLSEETLNNLRNIISSAVGLNKERGDVLEVINMNFSRDDSLLNDFQKPFIRTWAEDNLNMIIKILVMVLLVLVSLFFVVKPTINRVLNEQKAKREAAENFAKAKTESSVETKPLDSKEELIKRLEEFAKTSNNTIVEVLRNLIMKNQ